MSEEMREREGRGSVFRCRISCLVPIWSLSHVDVSRSYPALPFPLIFISVFGQVMRSCSTIKLWFNSYNYYTLFSFNSVSSSNSHLDLYDLSDNVDSTTRQTRLVVLVRFLYPISSAPPHQHRNKYQTHPSLLTRQIIQPPPIRLNELSLTILTRQIRPSQRVPDRRNLIRNIIPRKLGDLVVQVAVRPEVVEMVRDGIGIANVHEETRFAVLDLKRDSTGACRDHGFAVVKRFGDFDFETFTEGELEDDRGVRQERVQH